MSPEVSLFLETWNLFINHVHIRERLSVAESMLEIFEDHMDLSELELYKNEFDRPMKAAIVSKLHDELDDDAEDDWE
jgi:hypothetical protein